MKSHATREWSVEEFDAWVAASDRHDAVAEAADEAGGPSLSLVPRTDRREVWPTDLLPPRRWPGPRERPADGSGNAEPDRRHGSIVP